MATVVEQLRKTEKGQLKYYTNWNPRDLLKERPAAPVIRQDLEIVFEIKSIKAALEAIEDDAREILKISEEEAKIFRKTEVIDDGDLGEEYKIESFNPFSYDVILQDIESSVMEEKRRRDREHAQKREEFFEEIARITYEAAVSRREREMKKRHEEAEKEKRFFEKLEESAMKIRDDMQKREDDIIRTRHQREQERKLRIQLLERQKQKELFDKFSKIILEIQELYKDILAKIQNFELRNSSEFLQSRIPALLENCSHILKHISAEHDRIKLPENLTDQQVVEVKKYQHSLQVTQKQVDEEISIILKAVETKKLQEKAKAELIAKQQKEAAEAEQKMKSSKQSEVHITPKRIVKPSEERYQKLKVKMEEYESVGAKLSKSGSPELNKLVMHLSKAISLPIGSITGRSGSDVKRVVRILTKIIKSKEVTVGSKTLSTKGNSLAIKFAENLMAKKLVSQASAQVSSNFSSAFSIALIVIAVWAESPDFGDLFMAHLQSKCMYSVPRYHKLTASGSDDAEQLKLMGYEISDDGQIEGQDKFLRRMSGLIRLYAAVIQSPLPPGVSRHPHGLGQGWRWLAELLNMEPITDITTTVLYDFLEVAGHAMMRTYKSQFEKILSVICNGFYPKLEAVADDKSAVVRLKIFLEKCVREKKVPVPEGRLEKSFWNTYHSGEVVGE